MMNLDGTDALEFTRAGEGLPYGLSLSPDGKRVAFHLASPDGYQIWTSNTSGSDRVRVAAKQEHLYFGPTWSPDGRWLLYQDCHFKEDPGHDWSDLCLGRPDGTENRVLTTGQAHWFGATYGDPQNRGGGSNMPAWTGDGQILFSRKLPGSKVMDNDGRHPRMITRGVEDRGADHPRWLAPARRCQPGHRSVQAASAMHTRIVLTKKING